MELAAQRFPGSRILVTTPRLDARAAGAWTLGFAPIVYLALRGGGYDPVILSQVGLAIWWIVLLGILGRVFSLSGIGWPGWAAIGLLTGFGLWTLIATGWSSSDERTVAEVGRVASYLGFLVLGLCVLRQHTLRHLIVGMAVAFGVVSVLAVLSRLYPSAFPADQVPAVFHSSTTRLSYPLNYADGTGNFLAMGLPLLLVIATRAERVISQAIGAACVPVALLGIVFTASRGAVLTAIVAVILFYILAPDRLPKLATGLAVAAGSAILIAALLHRRALRDGLSTPIAITQRHQLAALLIIVCIGVALVQFGIGLMTRYAVRPSWLKITRRRAALATAVGLVVALAIAFAARLPGQLSHQWTLFKQANTGAASGTGVSRLGSITTGHRYHYWHTALEAYRSKPLTGIGPGTFEFYWAGHGSVHEFVRNAHSLYMETLAEAGLVGFCLVTGLILILLGAGVARALRAPPSRRTMLAVAAASVAAFCAAAGYDWMWQLPVAPVAALLLGSAIMANRNPQTTFESGSQARWRGWVLRAGIAGGALAAIFAIAIPYATTAATRSSQSAYQAGNLKTALADAATAQRLEPFAATPRLQRALILERSGDLLGASAAVSQAAARERTNWRIWLVRARIDAESGSARAAVRDYRRAHELNPKSTLTAE